MVVDRLKKGVCARTGERLSAAECGRPFSFLVAPEWAACRLDLGPRTPRLCLVCGTGEAACRVRSRSCAQSLTLFFFLCVRALLWRRPRLFFFLRSGNRPAPQNQRPACARSAFFLAKGCRGRAAPPPTREKKHTRRTPFGCDLRWRARARAHRPCRARASPRTRPCRPRRHWGKESRAIHAHAPLILFFSAPLALFVCHRATANALRLAAATQPAKGRDKQKDRQGQTAPLFPVNDKTPSPPTKEIHGSDRTAAREK